LRCLAKSLGSHYPRLRGTPATEDAHQPGSPTAGSSATPVGSAPTSPSAASRPETPVPGSLVDRRARCSELEPTRASRLRDKGAVDRNSQRSGLPQCMPTSLTSRVRCDSLVLSGKTLPLSCRTGGRNHLPWNAPLLRYGEFAQSAGILLTCLCFVVRSSSRPKKRAAGAVLKPCQLSNRAAYLRSGRR
jgi:hypothetical protein